MDEMSASPEGMDNLFRRESGRMVAAVTRIFGVHNLALAEGVVQDAFCRALEMWSIRGVPENPSAWLIAAAKRRALDVLRRDIDSSCARPCSTSSSTCTCTSR